MPDGRVCNWLPVLLTALPEVPAPVVTAPAFFCPLRACVALSFTTLLAASQHLPAADDLCFIDAAPATDVASTSTAAAVMSLFMMFSCAALCRPGKGSTGPHGKSSQCER